MTERKIQTKYKGIQFVEETTFETDPGSGYSRLHYAQNINVTLGQEIIPLETQKTSDMRGPDASVIGGKNGKLTFDLPLYTMSGSEVPAVSLMKRMGMELSSVAQKSGLVIGGAADEIHVLDVNNTGLDVGVGILHNPASGSSSIRYATRVETGQGVGTDETHVTVNQNFSVTPSSGDTIEALDTLTPVSGDPSKTFTFHCYLGQGTTNRMRAVLTGCSGMWKLNTTGPKNIPIISFDFNASSWSYSETNLQQTDPTGNAPNTILGGKVLIDGTETKTRSIAFDPAFDVQELESLDTNGRQGWNFADAVPALEIIPLHDTAWLDKFVAGTLIDFEFEMVHSDTNAWSFWAPTLQIISHEHEDASGLLHSKMGFLFTDPGDNADSELIPWFAFSVTK